jgi:hypothetical protein
LDANAICAELRPREVEARVGGDCALAERKATDRKIAPKLINRHAAMFPLSVIIDDEPLHLSFAHTSGRLVAPSGENAEEVRQRN